MTLCADGLGHCNKEIWKAKIPLKIKIWMWLISKNAILTKDNLIKRNWRGDKYCAFCSQEESIQHLMFDCPMASYVCSLTAHVFGISCRPTTFEQFWEWVSRFIPTGRKFHMVGLVAICWALWRARNNICFENKFVRSPTEVVCLVCSFLTYWAGLQKDDDRALLEAGIATLKATALEFHAQVYTQGGDFFLKK